MRVALLLIWIHKNKLCKKNNKNVVSSDFKLNEFKSENQNYKNILHHLQF